MGEGSEAVRGQTGITLATKRLGLLRELLPGLARVALLLNPASVANTALTLRDVEEAALGVQIQAFNADTGHEIDAAFQSMGRGRPDALFVAMTSFFIARRIQLVQLAAFHRLPAAYGVRDFAGVGGLMSYGSDLTDAYHQVGVYTGRILKGAKPADLPVVQSTKLELIINHQTARMLGLTVPDTLLARADEVIE